MAHKRRPQEPFGCVIVEAQNFAVSDLPPRYKCDTSIVHSANRSHARSRMAVLSSQHNSHGTQRRYGETGAEAEAESAGAAVNHLRFPFGSQSW